MLKIGQTKKKGFFRRSAIYVLMGTMMVFLLAGCKKSDSTDNSSKNDDPDATSSASIVDSASAFEKSIGADGNWIICLTKDLKADKDLVVDGEFTNGKKDESSGKDIVQRKIALYAQDEQRNITARYTLTVPKLTIKSPNASLQHGKFVGDVIVDAPNFQLVDNAVEGNIYFTSQEVKDSFTMDETSSVSGVQEVQ
ncbi:hypothetical protein [Anaerocolumna xylanovorans]|uniref:Lipoprotein n=1 Tax=Anaerocolumna xylanovorans DSM 12503 TaxID=1121345 RepID=A0A1M7XZV2_9FIRM|nr:hypothetical protein [Anaerocolumna xylanovorans]SHO44736.1 hypothetical protein SAMN02745217_00705 [Anaerocolumna xylanovorans DSM 12503]